MKVKHLILALMLLCSMKGWSHIIIISDLDDTVRKSNIQSFSRATGRYLKGVKPFLSMRDIFNEIVELGNSRGESVSFFYVTGSYRILYNAKKWLAKYKFPAGKVYQRKLHNWRDSDLKYYKRRILKKIIGSFHIDQSDNIILFGDNGQKDPQIYLNLKKELKLQHLKIFIRDVSTQSYPFTKELSVNKLPGIFYFLSEKSLANHKEFYFLSRKIKQNIYTKFKMKKLIAKFVHKKLYKRLEKKRCKTAEIENCKNIAKLDARKMWDRFYRVN